MVGMCDSKLLVTLLAPHQLAVWVLSPPVASGTTQLWAGGGMARRARLPALNLGCAPH